MKIKEAIESGCGTDAPGSLAERMCKHATVYSMKMQGKRYDIGNIESYNEIQRVYKGQVK